VHCRVLTGVDSRRHLNITKMIRDNSHYLVDAISRHFIASTALASRSPRSCSRYSHAVNSTSTVSEAHIAVEDLLKVVLPHWGEDEILLVDDLFNTLTVAQDESSPFSIAFSVFSPDSMQSPVKLENTFHFFVAALSHGAPELPEEDVHDRSTRMLCGIMKRQDQNLDVVILKGVATLRKGSNFDIEVAKEVRESQHKRKMYLPLLGIQGLSPKSVAAASKVLMNHRKFPVQQPR
jgi:hypothetical protein